MSAAGKPQCVTNMVTKCHSAWLTGPPSEDFSIGLALASRHSLRCCVLFVFVSLFGESFPM